MQGNLPSYNSDPIDIICFSLSRWDAEISSPAVALVKELSKNNRVFFIEHPYSASDIFLRKKNKSKNVRLNNITVITPPVTFSINFLPEGKIYNFFSSVNNSILLGTLKKTIRKNNISRFLFINFFDPFFLQSLPPEIKPLRYIYQCMDDLSQVAYTKRHGLRLENEVIGNADIVLCTSKELARLKSPLSKHVHFHPNGADFGLFNQAATQTLNRPADLYFNNKKIIGFTGSIEYRTDFALLKKIAFEHSDKILFLVGPVFGREHLDAALDQLPNIIFAGSRDISELPAYLQYFDCCIIPYKKNKLTSSIYPLKINEYLAAGKPVISTDFSEDIRSFHDTAYIAGSHDEFISLIGKAIQENDVEKKDQRIRVAAANSWEKRVEEFWKLVI